MGDYKLITMILIMLSIQSVLFLSQQAIDEVSTTGPTVFTFEGSLMDSYVDTGDNGTYITVSDANFSLSDGNQLTIDSGTAYIDTFKTVQVWFDDLNSDFGFVTSFLSQPYGFMVDIGIPQEICVAFGVIWYLILIMLFIGFIRGSNQ